MKILDVLMHRCVLDVRCLGNVSVKCVTQIERTLQF